MGEPELINAGKRRVTALPGASVLPPRRQLRDDPRRTPIDLCVLGASAGVDATAISPTGRLGEPDAMPAVGGAMDLVAGR